MIDITVEKHLICLWTIHINGLLVKDILLLVSGNNRMAKDIGVEFEGAFRYFPQSECKSHIVNDSGIGPRAALFMNRALYNKALELGVMVLLETAATQIPKEDGRVVGVRARGQNNEEIEVRCDAAIICTGGAGANTEMIKEYTGLEYGKDVYNFAVPGMVGDGIRMAWEAGADQMPIRIEMAADLKGGVGKCQCSPTLKLPNLL